MIFKNFPKSRVKFPVFCRFSMTGHTLCTASHTHIQTHTHTHTQTVHYSHWSTWSSPAVAATPPWWPPCRRGYAPSACWFCGMCHVWSRLHRVPSHTCTGTEEQCEKPHYIQWLGRNKDVRNHTQSIALRTITTGPVFTNILILRIVLFLEFS